MIEDGGVNRNCNRNKVKATEHTDNILKSANFAMLPIKLPAVKEIVNLKMAERIGVKVPLEILLEAHEVIR